MLLVMNIFSTKNHVREEVTEQQTSNKLRVMKAMLEVGENI